MSKRTNSILVLLFLFGLAFVSLPFGPRSTRKTGTKMDTQEPNQLATGNVQVTDSKSTVKKDPESTNNEIKNKYQQLQLAYQASLAESNARQLERDNIQKEQISLERQIEELSASELNTVTFEPREWASSDGRFKTIATLINSDFKNATLKKDDGTIIEVSKEKLSDADKQAIERAFAALEVAAKKNEERKKKIEDCRAKIKESIEKLRGLQIDKPVEPTIEDAKIAIMAERDANAKADLSQGSYEPSVLSNESILILDTQVTEQVNASGVPISVIETKFKNLGTEAVRVIDVEYSVSDASGKVVLRKPYTLFVALGEDSGLKPGDSRQTKEDGLHLPKSLMAKSAKTVVTKVLSFKRLDASKVGNGNNGDSREYVPAGIHFISSLEDPRTPGDFMHVYWSDKKSLDLNELIAFCRTFREKEAGSRFTYLVVFDAKQNAAYPQNPYTALYGVDFEIMEHIRFYYECNKSNGYSRLNFVKDTPPSGASHSIVVP